MTTPSEEEARARIIAELRWLADARDEYRTDTFPQIHREAETARHLADILERKTPVTEGGEGFGWLPSWKWDEWDALATRVSTPPSEDWEYRTTIAGHDPQPHGRLNRGDLSVAEAQAILATDPRPLILERRPKVAWEPVPAVPVLPATPCTCECHVDLSVKHVVACCHVPFNSEER